MLSRRALSAGRKSVPQAAWDFVGAPLRLLLLRDPSLRRLRLTTRQGERHRAVLPYVRGRLLDVGAGTNDLVREYGNGVGVDVRDWGGGALVVENSSRLPFADESFDTVTFLACLNHIPYRQAALVEARRLLHPGGRVVVTMIGPWLGVLGHRFWWYGGEPHRLGEGEDRGGMTDAHVLRLLAGAGFELESRGTFVYGMNHLYVARKPGAEGSIPT